MPYQNISAALTDANIQAIKDHAGQARTLMPFLQTLTAQDRIGLFKMGQGRLAWAEAGLEAAKNHPEILPGYFKVEEYEKDFDLARALADIRGVYESLFTDINDTTMGVGSEAANASSKVMGWVDDAAKTEPGLRSVAANLHDLYQRANAAGTTPAPAVVPAK